MDNCVKKFGSPSSFDLKNIDTFCTALRANKVKDGKALFYKLPKSVQCVFLYYANQILLNKAKYSEDSYLTAFRLFKLLRGKEDKTKDVYSPYNNPNLERLYKQALDWNKSESKSSSEKTSKSSSEKSSSEKSSSKSPGSRTKKKYENEYQKYDTPELTDPLAIFYTSLYTEKPTSPLAITWLAEHGLYPDGKQKKIIQAYKDGNIIKLK